MNPFQAVMVISTTSLLIVTAGLLIIRTMPSKPGVTWWLSAAFLQSVSYFLALLSFGEASSLSGQAAFFTLQMVSNLSVSIGILRFTDTRVNVYLRMASLVLLAGSMIAMVMFGFVFPAELLVAGYSAWCFFQAAFAIRAQIKKGFLLKLIGWLCFAIGVHWLDYPILGKVEWFMPIGFLLGVVLGLSLFFALSTLAMLQFKAITAGSERRAIHAATHDPLTGVYNRSYLPILFKEHKARVKKSKGTFIMLYLDLDGFKAVNDEFGHKAGDAILIVVTKRLSNWLGDRGDVIRIGGDELVVLNSLRSDANTSIIYGTSAAQSILKLIERPIADGENIYNISASIGGCYYSSELRDLESMLNKADELMYSAKEAGKRRVHFGNIPDGVAEEFANETFEASVGAKKTVAELANTN